MTSPRRHTDRSAGSSTRLNPQTKQGSQGRRRQSGCSGWGPPCRPSRRTISFLFHASLALRPNLAPNRFPAWQRWTEDAGTRRLLRLSCAALFFSRLRTSCSSFAQRAVGRRSSFAFAVCFSSACVSSARARAHRHTLRLQSRYDAARRRHRRSVFARDLSGLAAFALRSTVRFALGRGGRARTECSKMAGPCERGLLCGPRVCAVRVRLAGDT